MEELECLATWKEGSSRYLVGRLHHGHASSNEDRYRCFVYEKAGQTVQGNLNRAAMGMGTMDHEVPLPNGPMPEGTAEVYRVAQSGDATCNGLFSPMEGSRTMTLRKGESRWRIDGQIFICHSVTWLLNIAAAVTHCKMIYRYVRSCIMRILLCSFFSPVGVSQINLNGKITIFRRELFLMLNFIHCSLTSI